MNVTQARRLIKQIIPSTDSFYSITRQKDNFVLIVRDLTGWQLEQIQKHFKITYMLGQDYDYGDILIKMREKVERRVYSDEAGLRKK